MSFEKMNFDDMTDEQKRNCYESYCGDIRYEWGDNAEVMSFEEFCKENDGFMYD